MATAPEIRKANKRHTFHYIYSHRECSKQELASALGHSMPTVNQNIKELLQEGLIQIGGHFESSGGRKPAILQFVADARVSIGVEILEDYVFIALLDLYGTVLQSALLEHAYSNEASYFEKIGAFIREFSNSITYPPDRILGTTVSVQGITDTEHSTVVYGRILNNDGFTAEMLSRYIGKPCQIIHDSEAAAFAESFHRPGLRDSCYIFLNKYMGSASILNGSIYRGIHGRGQLVEHMKIVPSGKRCYCGKQGCAECYISANSLQNASGENAAIFFEKLRSGCVEEAKIWENYLDYLSDTLYNVQMVMDVDIIIGGKLRHFMNNDDLARLRSKIDDISSFAISDRTISLEHVADHSAAHGAALYLINRFLTSYEQSI